MKRNFVYGIVILGITILIVACSKKEDEPVVPQPDYPQLIGTWKGTTWQNTPITLKVANIGGTLYLTSLSYSVKLEHDSSYHQRDYTITLTSGIVPVTNKQFSVSMAALLFPNDTLSGTFNTDSIKVTGLIVAEFSDSTLIGTYNGLKQ